MISLKPVACKQCESVFCRECLNTWLKKHNTCPLRCKNFDINEEPRLVKNILSKFYYSCKNCKNKICLNDFDHHSQTCSESKINCNDCNQLIRKSFLPTHLKLFCENATVQCDLCKSIVKRKNLGSAETELNATSAFYLKRIKELEKELSKKDEMIEGLQMSIQNLTKKEVDNQIKKKRDSANNIIIDLNDNKEQIKFENDLVKITGNIEQTYLSVDVPSLGNNIKSMLLMNNIDYIEGSLIAMSFTNGCLMIYSIQTNIFTKIQAHINNIISLKYIYLSQTNKVVLYTISIDQTIVMWDSNNFGCLKTLKISYSITSACFLDNDFLVIGDNKGFLHLYDLNILEEILSSNVCKEKINNIKYISQKKLICCTIENKVLLVDLFTLNKISESKIVLDSKYVDIEYYSNSDRLFCITEKGSVYNVQLDLDTKKVDKILDLKIQSRHQLKVSEKKGVGIIYIFSPFYQLSIFSVKQLEEKLHLENIYLITDKTLIFFGCQLVNPINIVEIENLEEDSVNFIYANKTGRIWKGEIKLKKKI